MNFHSLPKRSLVIWEALAVVLFGAGIFAAWVLIPQSLLIWYAVIWLLGALFILVAFLYLPLLYLSFSYCLSDTDIIVKGGVVFYKMRFLKRDKVSFVSVYNTPLTPFLKVSMLLITAPGAHLVIPFLAQDEADRIADALNRRLSSHDANH